MMDLPEVYRQHLQAATGDPRALTDVWEPDGVLEFPYAADGAVARLDGVEAMIEYFAGLTGWSEWSFGGAVVRGIADRPEEYLVELHGSARRHDGGRYDQDYVVRFGLSAPGRIAWMREFWDPTRFG